MRTLFSARVSGSPAPTNRSGGPMGPPSSSPLVGASPLAPRRRAREGAAAADEDEEDDTDPSKLYAARALARAHLLLAVYPASAHHTSSLTLIACRVLSE